MDQGGDVLISRLDYNEVGSTSAGYTLIAVDALTNSSAVIDQLITWCRDTADVERVGQMIHIRSEEAYTMFKLAWQ